MPITALPTPPSRQDPANFSSRTDAFLLAMVQFAEEMNAGTPGESAFALAQLLAGTATGEGAAAIGCKHPSAGGVARTQHDKNLDFIHAADVGAVGAGDDTAKLLAVFDYAIPLARPVTLRGAYTVSGPISSGSTLAAGSLHIRCDGDVTITVDAGSVAFSRLLSCETTAANSVSITGGTLTIVGNSKVGSAVYARHYGQGGTVKIDALKVTGCKQSGGSAIENAGLYLLGRYRTGDLGVIDVDGVDRADSATASRGVLIQDVEGPFTVRSLRIANVLATGFAADADGLYFSGYTSGASTTQRAGSLTVLRAEFRDCQGRSIKVQHQDVTIRDIIIRRQLVTTFNAPDVDFQLGGGQIDALQLNYFKNGGSSPLHASFYPIASQHTCTDRATTCRIGKVTLRSEVQLPRLVQVIVGATALDGGTLVDDVDLIPYNGFSGSFFARCALEFDAGQVAASSNKTHLSVRNVRGEMSGVPILGHTAFGASVAAKLSVEAILNNNTGTPASGNKTISAISGGDIPALQAFNFRDNAGFHGLMMATFAFNTQTLASGCKFSYARATAVVTNGPAIAAGTYVDVECLGSINGTTRKVRMTVDNAGTMDEWYTQSGAWGVIK